MWRGFLAFPLDRGREAGCRGFVGSVCGVRFRVTLLMVLSLVLLGLLFLELIWCLSPVVLDSRQLNLVWVRYICVAIGLFKQSVLLLHFRHPRRKFIVYFSLVLCVLTNLETLHVQAHILETKNSINNPPKNVQTSVLCSLRCVCFFLNLDPLAESLSLSLTTNRLLVICI